MKPDETTKITNSRASLRQQGGSERDRQGYDALPTTPAPARRALPLHVTPTCSGCHSVAQLPASGSPSAATSLACFWLPDNTRDSCTRAPRSTTRCSRCVSQHTLAFPSTHPAPLGHPKKRDMTRSETGPNASTSCYIMSECYAHSNRSCFCASFCCSPGCRPSMRQSCSRIPRGGIVTP